MKTLFILFVGILIMIGSISKVNAAGLINMSTTVVARKSTDTINDFNFSFLNNASVSAENQAVASIISGQGVVKGVATQSSSSVYHNFFKQVINNFTALWRCL